MLTKNHLLANGYTDNKIEYNCMDYATSMDTCIMRCPASSLLQRSTSITSTMVQTIQWIECEKVCVVNSDVKDSNYITIPKEYIYVMNGVPLLRPFIILSINESMVASYVNTRDIFEKICAEVELASSSLFVQESLRTTKHWTSTSESMIGSVTLINMFHASPDNEKLN